MSSRLVTGACVWVAATTVFAACSGERDRFDPAPGPFPITDADEAGDCGFRCSPDLKKILRTCGGEDLEVVETCGPDLGCGEARCVDACASAELSKGSTGCSFWAVAADDERNGAGTCYAALVANTWDRPVNLTAEYDGAPLDISRSIYTATRAGLMRETYTALEGPLPPGQVAIVFLSQAKVPTALDPVLCPQGVHPALDIDPFKHGTARSKAIRLQADAPISAYTIFPYGGADASYPTATLLFPVSSWEKNYIAVTTGKFGNPNERGPLSRRTLQIVASEDGTEVTMVPTVDIRGSGDVEGTKQATAKTWTLARGETLQLVQNDSMSGSPITANKPVGVFGGSPCTFLPIEVGACDLTQQQIPPLSHWGMDYPLVPFLSRVEGAAGEMVREMVAWTLVGAADGTELTYHPAKPVGAPERLAAGQVVDFMTDAIVSVRSQDSKHPFFAGVNMTGAQFGGGIPGRGNNFGDPEFVNIVPAEQFLDRYVFFADYTYPNTTLTVVRKATPRGFMPVELDCGGEIEGFRPLGTSGEFEYAWVKLTSGFFPQKIGGAGECGYGRHEARSRGPFSVTVWGTGPGASYGFAGGTGLRPVNDAPMPPVN